MDTSKITLKNDTIISLLPNKKSEFITIKTIDFSEKIKNTNWYDSQLLQCLIWPITILLIILLFYCKIKKLIEHIINRIGNGDDIEVGKGGFKMGKGAKAAPFDKSEDKAVFFNPNFPAENETAKKIMSTFWIHQNEYDPSLNIRWTFKIGSDPDFDATINRLHWLGIVAYDPANTQFFLTDFGIHYCYQNHNKLGSFSYFKQTQNLHK